MTTWPTILFGLWIVSWNTVTRCLLRLCVWFFVSTTTDLPNCFVTVSETNWEKEGKYNLPRDAFLRLPRACCLDAPNDLSTVSAKSHFWQWFVLFMVFASPWSCHCLQNFSDLDVLFFLPQELSFLPFPAEVFCFLLACASSSASALSCLWPLVQWLWDCCGAGEAA